MVEAPNARSKPDRSAKRVRYKQAKLAGVASIDQLGWGEKDLRMRQHAMYFADRHLTFARQNYLCVTVANFA